MTPPVSSPKLLLVPGGGGASDRAGDPVVRRFRLARVHRAGGHAGGAARAADAAD